MTPTGSTRVAAVVGHPVAHSLSPALHNAAFAESGVDWVFVALDVAPADGPAIVDAARRLGLAGLAVTTPHKEAVAGSVDSVDPAARALDSVNTVVVCDDGTTVGSSTDGAGFVAALHGAGVEVARQRVAIVGAGAAARSVIDALARSDVDEIVVINRSADRAARAAGLAPCARVGAPSDIASVDIVVNATSIGMGASADAGELPVDVDLLSARHVVADLVYHPLETGLLAAARRAGATVVDGLGMLVHQAALQQQLWTGVLPDTAVMRAAATTELARRHR